VIRCLGRRRIRTFFVSDKKDFVRFSRWTIPVLLHMDPFPSSQELACFLDGLDIERAVIFPCSDSFLKAVTELPDRLTSRFPSSLPTAETQETLVDKGRFAKVLNENGIPHPETLIIESRARLESLDAGYFKGFFLKPCHSKEFQHHFHTKAFRISGLEDALNKYEIIRRFGQSVMLQEYIPGSADQHYFVDGFVDKGGVIRVLFVRRRIRIFPPYFGNSSYCVSIAPETAAGALDSVRRLISRSSYRGIFSAEFKWAGRDNHSKILEVNARHWGYIEFAAACGVDTCWMAYRDALGMPVASVDSYREGKGCMYSLNDFLTAWKLFTAGRMSPVSWVREFLRAKKPVFSWDDPLPSAGNLIEKPWRFIKNKLSH